MNKDFRPIVIGYGVQGKKRAKIIGSNLVAIIDNNVILYLSVSPVPDDLDSDIFESSPCVTDKLY